MDRADLADFLRRRRHALQPEDVGLPRGPRRRTSGLRREEVAALVGMSTDYYSRIERQRGPQPSEQMVAAIARSLRLSLDERDHLFVLAGHTAPHRSLRSDHVDPGVMRILDRLDETPAEVITLLGETLVQTRLAVALVGDQTQHTGMMRSAFYRWFVDPEAREVYPEDDHEMHGRIFTSQLRRAVAQGGPGSRAAAMADALRRESPEFTRFWGEHEVGLRYDKAKRFAHREVGEMTLYCQMLVDTDQSQCLLVYTATPGTQSHERLSLLSVVGDRGARHVT